METKNSIKQWIIFSLTSILIFLFAGLVYASTVIPNQPLTADLFNEKTVPSGAVMAFNLSVCPDGWKIADGTNWTQDLRDEFIRWAKPGAGREVWTTQPATSIDLSHWDYKMAWNNQVKNYDWSYNTNESTITITSWRTWANETRTWAKVRPQNVALLFCEKE